MPSKNTTKSAKKMRLMLSCSSAWSFAGLLAFEKPFGQAFSG